MIRRKVNAFTIMEVTITMLIASIVIAITYTSYSIVIKSYNSFTTKNNDLGVLINLDHVLRRDLNKADSVLKTPSGILLTNDSLQITYEFSSDKIIRTSVKSDTFKVSANNANFNFEGVAAESQEDIKRNLVDQIGFTVLYQKDSIYYSFHKNYSSENLINRNPNAVN